MGDPAVALSGPRAPGAAGGAVALDVAASDRCRCASYNEGTAPRRPAVAALPRTAAAAGSAGYLITGHNHVKKRRGRAKPGKIGPLSGLVDSTSGTTAVAAGRLAVPPDAACRPI